LVNYELVVNTADVMTTMLNTVKEATQNGMFGKFNVDKDSITATRKILLKICL